MTDLIEEKLVWVDVETTGLDPARDYIVEIAIVITDKQLNVIAIGPVLTIYQPPEILEFMDKFCINLHTKSGLITRIPEGIPMADAERQCLEFIKQHVSKKKQSICGNSVHFDRAFLKHHMRELHDYFGFRNLDVSSVRELAYLYNPTVPKLIEKKYEHTAFADIMETINELKVYKEHFLKEVIV